MIDLIDLSRWKKQNEIINELHREWGKVITSRTWRAEVEKWNKRFVNGDVPYYVTHSRFGFKSTKDYRVAKIGRDDYFKRACNMMKKVYECDRAFNQLHNYKYDFERGEII
jgi:hypothetical protein